MNGFRLLSSSGSDRASAYNMSNKIIRRGDQLLVTWLDAPVVAGEPSRVTLGICSSRGVLRQSMELGAGSDNANTVKTSVFLGRHDLLAPSD